MSYTRPVALYTSFLLILRITFQVEYYYDVYFTEKETDTEKSNDLLRITQLVRGGTRLKSV